MSTQSSLESSASSYRLSRYFLSYPSDEIMSTTEETIKSVIALTIGIVPFTTAALALAIFRQFAALGNALEEYPSKNALIKIGQIGNGIAGTFTATIVMSGAELFSISQKLVWGHYIEQPTGDTINSRLAQYGATSQPWMDLKNIFQAFFFADTLSNSQWKLRQWKQVCI